MAGAVRSADEAFRWREESQMSRRGKIGLIVAVIAGGAIAAGWAFRERFEDDDERTGSSERTERTTAPPTGPTAPAPPPEKPGTPTRQTPPHADRAEALPVR